jgi:hypothetical protein
MRPADISDLADRRRERVVEDDEIVVRIEREMVRIKWTFGLGRRAQQFLGESARHREERGGESESV